MNKILKNFIFFDHEIIKNYRIAFMVNKWVINKWLEVANVGYVIITQKENVLKKNVNAV